jgi:hypothetical protein
MPELDLIARFPYRRQPVYGEIQMVLVPSAMAGNLCFQLKTP